MPFIQDPDFTLWVGDVREVLLTLPPASVDCVVTSPPFYGLRDYGVEGQIGLEESVDEWAEELVGVFAETHRVLSKTGTLWVEIGDSYNAGTASRRINYRDRSSGQNRVDVAGLKPKDLIGQPWLLAFALRNYGWYLRQCIIWNKPNAMPESIKDRCTTAHSYVFLFSKSQRYFFDSEAIAEPAEWARWGDQTNAKYEGTDTATGWMQPKTKAELMNKKRSSYRSGGTTGNTLDGHTEKSDAGFPVNETGTKNPRSVWTIPTAGFAGAHFATWPEALVERIIKAGCPEGGTVLDPFMGSGTTALVARRLGRRSVGIELNPEYAEIAAERLGQQSLLA